MPRWEFSWVTLIREAGQKWLADNCLRLGASVSYGTSRRAAKLADRGVATS